MGKLSMEQELERLRAEVAELTARCNAAESRDADLDEPTVDVADSTPDSSIPNSGNDSVIKHQFEELLQLVEHEMRDLPTITCISVFAIGIIFGRYLR
ncbi:MAG: hypothetical protein GY768_14425 [Planctomycetaceae bacterium]|nr:hypothetical protein [Planctomycetaceae bacterium]